jgi:copper(I)-binding protein
VGRVPDASQQRPNAGPPLREETSVATRAEIFEAATEAPVAPYRPREDGVVVPPGGSLAVGPGGLYLSPVDPVASLRGGDRFPLTPRFAEGCDMTVIVSVDAVGGAPLCEGPHVAPSDAPRP